MTELEKIANRSWEENNTISIEDDNEDVYKAGYITGFKKCFELNEGVEVENERLKAIILGNEEEISKLEKENESLVNIKNIYIYDLIKAKELLKEYMRFEPMIGYCSFYSEEYEKTKAKAEQFLKESE